MINACLEAQRLLAVEYRLCIMSRPISNASGWPAHGDGLQRHAPNPRLPAT